MYHIPVFPIAPHHRGAMEMEVIADDPATPMIRGNGITVGVIPKGLCLLHVLGGRAVKSAVEMAVHDDSCPEVREVHPAVGYNCTREGFKFEDGVPLVARRVATFAQCPTPWMEVGAAVAKVEAWDAWLEQLKQSCSGEGR